MREITLHALEGTGGTALYLHLDVTRQQDWNAMVAAVLGRFGTLDILVNTSRGTATSLQMRCGYGTG